MIQNYISKGVSGLMPLATTGETPTLLEYEYESILEKTVEYTENKVPLYIGFGGNNTEKMAKSIKMFEKYIEIFNKVKQNDHFGAFEIWKKVAPIIPLLFEEPNPAPVKYCLSKLGLIKSPEVRLPLVEISEELAEKINKII